MLLVTIDLVMILTQNCSYVMDRLKVKVISTCHVSVTWT